MHALTRFIAPLHSVLAIMLFAATLIMARGALAQDDPGVPPFSADELEELIGPIALYPDDLIAIILPAATYPLDIVEATRFLDAREADPAIEPDDEWDDSVVALLNYPEVLRWMVD